MKLAILSESSADELALQVLVESVVGPPVELVSSVNLRSRGWPSVLNVLPQVYRALYYNTDADGLLVVVDSDDSPIHNPSVAGAVVCDADCRICLLRQRLERVASELKPRSMPGQLSTAIGLCVPSIEAWFRCGIDPHATESRFARERNSGKKLVALRRQLKFDVYGSERPSLLRQTEEGMRQAKRLSKDLPILERHFPIGFGTLSQMIRNWQTL